MDILQEFGILDTIKNACYLFLGLITGYIFWELCEHYCARAISHINPLLFILALGWGASGFFFLPPTFLPVDPFLQYAFPDWDIPLSLLLKSHFLQHRSWLFSSTLIPLVSLSIITLLQFILNQKTLQKRRFLIFLLNSLRDICIGFLVGITAHLIGDLIFQWIPSGDIGITVSGWQELHSYIWLVLSLLFGFSIPFISVSRIQVSVRDDESVEQNSTKVLVNCPSCAAQLRLPAGRTGKVTCPRCSHSFNATTL